MQNYGRVDISSTYQFDLSKNIKANIGASVWNLFNRKNTLNTYYRLDNSDSIEQVSQLSLGITPNISFRVSF